MKTGIIVIIGLVSLTLMSFGGFKFNEYWKGNPYINYLEKNIESKPYKEQLSFNIMKKDIEKHKIILTGEIHGFKASCGFDVDLYGHLRKEHDFNYYFVEMDYVQAFFLNEFNKSGDKKLLKKILENWVVDIGRENTDYFNKFVQLREIYLEAPFAYIGNDKLKDLALTSEYIRQQYGLEKSEFNHKNEIPEKARVLGLEINGILEDSDLSEAERWELQYISKNLSYVENQKHREEVLTENFLELYDHLNLSKYKVYGFYGLGHTLLASFDGGYTAMAARLLQKRKEFNNQLLSINCIYLDSKMAIHSEGLPSFLRDYGKYTVMSVSHDDLFTSYLYGIEDLKRVSEPHTKSLIKLNGDNSPYNKSQRLFSMTKLLPIGQVINARKDKVSTDYSQYLVLFRNSDWASPTKDKM